MYPNPMVEGDDYSFKRPGAVPFKWEVRPGVPKTQPGDDDHPTLLLQPPKRLAPLRLKPFPPSESKSRPVSPFAPPSSFKLKSPPSDSDSQCSGPPTPYFRSSPPRVGGCFYPKSLFGWKKSKSSDIKKTGQESSSSSSSEFENFYETGSTFSRSEDSSQGSVSSRWGSPKSSFSSRRGSPLKRTDSDCMRKNPF
ncbi:PREDICTED: probable serine/threonine-protein kinase samkC [Camelina sativa]|uniref:Probable serine/threonine-protein kinase samkC n=1 Tax=Camelina sativa TaxID=90675 RepID=A0ABM0VR17_CAMSA|nr:PREDICTED: probable serine/threonine-protein kinase samkC [Camelina sativa]